MAAIQGDIIFQAPRRFFLETTSKTQTAFAFRMFSSHPSSSLDDLNAFLVFKRGKAVPQLGAFHGSDIPEFFGTGVAPDFIGTDALGMFSNLVNIYLLPWLTTGVKYYPVNFANTYNPTIPHNPKSLLSAVDWQPWGSSSDHPILTFLDPAPMVIITSDTFRVNAMNLLNKISLELASHSWVLARVLHPWLDNTFFAEIYNLITHHETGWFSLTLIQKSNLREERGSTILLSTIAALKHFVVEIGCNVWVIRLIVKFYHNRPDSPGYNSSSSSWKSTNSSSIHKYSKSCSKFRYLLQKRTFAPSLAASISLACHTCARGHTAALWLHFFLSEEKTTWVAWKNITYDFELSSWRNPRGQPLV